MLDAGVREIADSGLEASLDAICARAKLTRGAFYVHFEDREAFLVAVMQHVVGGFVSSLTQRPPTETITDAIRAFFDAVQSRSLLTHGSKSATGLRFHHVMEACRRSKQIGDTYRSVVMLGRDQLTTMLAGQPDSSGLPAEALADLLVILALGVTTMAELGVPLDTARLANSAVSLITSGRS